jgi:uncharacterized protein (TIGR03083 family)
MDAMALGRDERLDFADFLAGLSVEQWDGPTLCDGWTVRDVVAHIMSYEGLATGQLVGRFLRGGLMTDRINAIGVADLAGYAPERLVAMVREHAYPTGLGAGFGGRISLTDNMIHQQDVRRALGLPRTIAPARLTVALDFARFAPLIRGAWRARGTRLLATDVDWSHGRGPEVAGPGEALLMAMAGRADALGDLDGPGLTRLAARF